MDILLDSTCSTEILSWKLSRVKFKNGIYLTRSSFYGFISSEFGALHEYFLRSIVILKHPQKIGSIFFSKLGALWLYEVWTFQLLQSVLKKVTPAASSRKGIMYQWKIEFCWSIPQKGASFGHLGARDDPTYQDNKTFDEMRLSRSLKPLRLLRLLRILRLKMF